MPPLSPAAIFPPTLLVQRVLLVDPLLLFLCLMLLLRPCVIFEALPFRFSRAGCYGISLAALTRCAGLFRRSQLLVPPLFATMLMLVRRRVVAFVPMFSPALLATLYVIFVILLSRFSRAVCCGISLAGSTHCTNLFRRSMLLVRPLTVATLTLIRRWVGVLVPTSCLAPLLQLYEIFVISTSRFSRVACCGISLAGLMRCTFMFRRYFTLARPHPVAMQLLVRRRWRASSPSPLSPAYGSALVGVPNLRAPSPLDHARSPAARRRRHPT